MEEASPGPPTPEVGEAPNPNEEDEEDPAEARYLPSGEILTLETAEV